MLTRRGPRRRRGPPTDRISPQRRRSFARVASLLDRASIMQRVTVSRLRFRVSRLCRQNSRLICQNSRLECTGIAAQHTGNTEKISCRRREIDKISRFDGNFGTWVASPAPLARSEMSIRIALIHAVTVAVAPVETAFRELWPEAECVNILDELVECRPRTRRAADRGDDRADHRAGGIRPCHRSRCNPVHLLGFWRGDRGGRGAAADPGPETE